MKKFKFTKKIFKSLWFKFNWGTKKRHDFKQIVLPKPNRSASLLKFYSFFLLNRQFFRNVYFGFTDKSFKKFHKIHFKKDRKRLYFQIFFLSLERRSCTILFQSRLVSKIKKLKKLVLNRKIFINGFFKSGYGYAIKPLDFVYTSIQIFNKKITQNKINSFSFFFYNKMSDYSNGLFLKGYTTLLKNLAKSLKMNFKPMNQIFFFKIKKRFYLLKKNLVVFNLILWFSLKESFFWIKLKWIFSDFCLKYIKYIKYSYHCKFLIKFYNYVFFKIVWRFLNNFLFINRLIGVKIYISYMLFILR